MTLKWPLLYFRYTLWPYDVRPYNIYKSASLLFPQKPLALLALFRGPRRRSAEYGRTSPDSTNRQTHKSDTAARRYGAAPADPLGFGCRYSRRACTYLYHFSFSLYYSHPCIRLIHLWHPRNHLTAYLAIAFNLTPSVERFYSRPYSTRSTRKYIATYKLFFELLSISQSPRSFVFSGQLW